MNCQQNQKGFTLIELLVSMFLIMMVMGAAYTIYSGSSRAATMQTQDSRMQDNARMAMDVLARHIKLAGFLVNFSNYPKTGDFGGLTTKMRFENHADAPDGIIIAGIPNRGSVTSLNASAGKGAISLNLTPAGAVNDYVQGDVVGIGLADTARLLSRTGVVLNLDNLSGGAPTPAAALNLNYPGNEAGKTSAIVVRLMVSTFGIVSDGTNSHPFLQQDDFVNIPDNIAPNPVAEDIEDMQFAFGVDLNNNMIVEPAEWINNRPLTDEEAEKIRLVRVTIVARTAQEDPALRGLSRAVPAIEDRPEWNTTDGYRRYILRRTIGCRNMNTVYPL